VDSLAWVATGSYVNQVIKILERCTAKSIAWAGRRRLQFDTAKMEVALFTPRLGYTIHLLPKRTAKIMVGEGFILFNRQATCWLSIWMDVNLTLQEVQN
jgi:hypothetical protein